MSVAIKERPILMNGEMVRATLADLKMQTRRIIKPTPEVWIDRLHGNNLRGRAPYNVEHEETGATVGYGFQSEDTYYKCRYGRPGELLWVRETLQWDSSDAAWTYKADGSTVAGSNALNYHQYSVPSIHMPRWASRITLEITDVRVERLNDISSQDALAEGVGQTEFWTPSELEGRPFEEKWWDDYHFFENYPQIAFKRLWESINGPGSWEANPWVWVVEFRRIEVAQ